MHGTVGDNLSQYNRIRNRVVLSLLLLRTDQYSKLTARNEYAHVLKE